MLWQSNAIEWKGMARAGFPQKVHRYDNPK